MSVIRCLAGVLSGNDELAFCEKQFIAAKETSLCFQVVFLFCFIDSLPLAFILCWFTNGGQVCFCTDSMNAFSRAPIILSNKLILILCNRVSDP